MGNGNNNCAVGVCSSPEHCIEIGRCFSSGFSQKTERDRQLRADAFRYRWLRDSPRNTEVLRALIDGVPSVIGGHNEFDAAIDAAMLKTINVEVG